MMGFKDFMENCNAADVVSTFGVISGMNPQGVRISDEANKDLDGKLKFDLTSMGCLIKDFQGKFAGNQEIAYIVSNINREDLADLSHKYAQKAYIWAYKQGDRYYLQYFDNGKMAKETSIPIDKRIKDVQSFLRNFEIPQF